MSYTGIIANEELCEVARRRAKRPGEGLVAHPRPTGMT